MMKYALVTVLITFLPCALMAASATDCAVSGKIVEMGVGYSNTVAADGEGGTREMQVKYTLVSVQLTDAKGQNAGCAKKSKNEVRKYGLCEDINVYQGDIIDAQTSVWNYGGECLWAINVLKRTWQPADE